MRVGVFGSVASPTEVSGGDGGKNPKIGLQSVPRNDRDVHKGSQDAVGRVARSVRQLDDAGCLEHGRGSPESAVFTPPAPARRNSPALASF